MTTIVCPACGAAPLDVATLTGPVIRPAMITGTCLKCYAEVTVPAEGHQATCQWEPNGVAPVAECGLPATVVHVEQGVDPWDDVPYVVVRTLCPEHAQDARDEADSWPVAVCATYTQRSLTPEGLPS